jgi:hypothetical protein
VFAAVLLVWTAADLIAHGLCTHSHGRIGAFEQSAFRAPSSDPAAPHEVDDCFCCSHIVDVRSRFQITVDSDVAWTLPDEVRSRPQLNAASLYHPPLA